MFEPKLRELARSLAVLIRTQAEEADDAEEQADLQDDIEFPITIHCSGRLDVRAQPTPPSPFPYFTLPIGISSSRVLGFCWGVYVSAARADRGDKAYRILSLTCLQRDVSYTCTTI
jgi:hypothetical protein